MDQLALQAGHPLDLGRIGPDAWIAASRAAQMGRYEAMAAEIRRVAMAGSDPG